MQHFVSIVTEEAKTLPDEDGMWGSEKGRGKKMGGGKGGGKGGG